MAERREAARTTTDRLDGLLVNPGQKERIQRILEIEEEMYRVLSGGPHPPGVELKTLDRFVELNALARQVVGESDRLAILEVDAMQEAAARAQRNTVWAALALIPITILVSALFAGLLSTPIPAPALHRCFAPKRSRPVASPGSDETERTLRQCCRTS